MSFTFIDLFAGIGGFRMAAQASGGRCVMSCEWDKHARETYKANFDTIGHAFHHDIRELNADDVPDHDLLTGGFPCQSFSQIGIVSRRNYGHAHGLDDERQGQLFFEIVRILKAKRPAMFLLENVPALQKSDDGRAYVMIVETLQSLGYDVHCQIVNANAWVPQTRKRLFFAGFRDAHSFRWSDFRIPSARPVLRSILHPEDGTELPEYPYTLAGGVVNPKYTVSAERWKTITTRMETRPDLRFHPTLRGDDEQASTLCARYVGGGSGSFVPAFKPHLKDKDEVSTTVTARYRAGVSNTLVKQRTRPRFFTPRECSRLMGFDAPGGADFIIPVSDAQAWKQFGNSVVVPCVAAIVRAMLGMDGDDDGEPVSDNLSLW